MTQDVAKRAKLGTHCLSIAICAVVALTYIASAAGAGGSPLPRHCTMYSVNPPGTGWHIGIFVAYYAGDCASNNANASIGLGCLPNRTHEWLWAGDVHGRVFYFTRHTRSFMINTRSKIGYLAMSLRTGAVTIRHIVARVVFTGKFSGGAFTGRVAMGGTPCKPTSYTARLGSSPTSA